MEGMGYDRRRRHEHVMDMRGVKDGHAHGDLCRWEMSSGVVGGASWL